MRGDQSVKQLLSKIQQKVIISPVENVDIDGRFAIKMLLGMWKNQVKSLKDELLSRFT